MKCKCDFCYYLNKWIVIEVRWWARLVSPTGLQVNTASLTVGHVCGLCILSVSCLFFCLILDPLLARLQSGNQILYKDLEGRCQKTRETAINQAAWSTVWSLQGNSGSQVHLATDMGPAWTGGWRHLWKVQPLEKQFLLRSYCLLGSETNYLTLSAETTICQQNHQSGGWARRRGEESKGRLVPAGHPCVCPSPGLRAWPYESNGFCFTSISQISHKLPFKQNTVYPKTIETRRFWCKPTSND